ncbi:MAG: type II secretion system protein [Bradymonadales bacterium]|nr:MAG: type II secretion system protein [Bradymonadales bacterium]
MGNLNSFRISRAVSLVELMIGLVIFSGLAISIVLLITQGSEQRRIETAKVQLRQQSDFVRSRIQEDFQNVARTYGWPVNNAPDHDNTATDIWWAIQRIDPSTGASLGVRTGSGPALDSFSLYLASPLELSYVIEDIVADSDSSGDFDWFVLDNAPRLSVPEGFSLSDPAVVLAWNARNFMRAKVQDPEQELFLLYSDEDVLIVRKEDFEVDGNQLRIRFALPGDIDPRQIFRSKSPRIRAVSRVDYLATADGLRRIERKANAFSSDNVVSDEFLTEALTEFRADFFFANRRGVLDVQSVTAPSFSLSHPVAAPSGSNVTWSEASAITGQLSARRENLFDNAQDQVLGGNYIQQASDLVMRASLGNSVVGSEFRMAGFTGGDVSSGCIPTNVSSHCDPNCSHLFTDPNRDSPTWAGYGDLDGDYCLCARAPDGSIQNLSDPATFASIPALTWTNGSLDNPGDRERVEACIRSMMTSCDSPWRERDPRTRLICSTCLQSEYKQLLVPGYTNHNENFSQYRPSPLSHYSTHQAAEWNQLESFLGAVHSASDKVSREDFASSYPNAHMGMRCWRWNNPGIGGCHDLMMNAYPALSRTVPGYRRLNNQAISLQVSPIMRICQCETIRTRWGRTATGVNLDTTSSGTPVPNDRGAFYWNALCSPDICPFVEDTATERQYQLKSQYLEQGLTELDAAYCACRSGLTSPALSSFEEVPRLTNNWYDFRDQSLLPSTYSHPAHYQFTDMPNAASQPANQFGISQREVRFRVVGEAEPRSRLCGEVECSHPQSRWQPSVGCCLSRQINESTHDFHTTDARVNFRGSDPGSGFQGGPFSGYCSGSCSKIGGTQAVRASLFSSATLPSYCCTGNNCAGPPPDDDDDDDDDDESIFTP